MKKKQRFISEKYAYAYTNKIKRNNEFIINSLLFWKKAQELFLINNAHEFT